MAPASLVLFSKDKNNNNNVVHNWAPLFPFFSRHCQALYLARVWFWPSWCWIWSFSPLELFDDRWGKWSYGSRQWRTVTTHGETSPSQSSQEFDCSFIVVRELGWIHGVQLSNSDATIEYYLNYLLDKPCILPTKWKAPCQVSEEYQNKLNSCSHLRMPSIIRETDTSINNVNMKVEQTSEWSTLWLLLSKWLWERKVWGSYFLWGSDNWNMKQPGEVFSTEGIELF